MATKKDQSDKLDDKLMDHDYDGINELDNPPPRWIMALFYVTIGFSILYGAYYFWLDVGDHQDAEYARKSTKHDNLYKVVSLSSDELVILTDASDIEEGKQVYNEMNCYACHGMNGEGNAVGPNLTDEHWILGGGIKNVFKTITEGGRDGKGMIAWKTSLKPSEINQVASYLLTFQGTTPAEPKDPEGDIWVEESVPQAGEATETEAPTETNEAVTDSVTVALN